jgi:hypothetical protein
MKKSVLIILITLFCLTAKSQNSEIKYGIKAGANLSKYTPEIFIGNTVLADYQFKVGFYFGGFSNIKITENLRFQPEILFVNQGTRIVVKGLNVIDSRGGFMTRVGFKSQIDESVLALPLNLRYFASSKFYFEGGIQLGYIVDKQEKIIENPFPETMSESNFTNYDKFDFGFNLGLGLKLTESLRINARSVLGIIERDDAIKPLVFNIGIEYEL